MAKRKVQRRARKILGEDPVALVWCEIGKPIPAPPKAVHRAAGKGRLKPRHHWLLYVGGAVFFFVVVPMMVVDKLGDVLNGQTSSGESGTTRNRTAGSGRHGVEDPTRGVFDGDWNLTAGQMLLRWYSHSPNPKRLVMLARDRVCVAASPRRTLSPTQADDFRTIAEFSFAEARIEAEAGQPRGFATFRIRFTDGSWLELGRLGEPEDADRFLRTVSA
ncbi:hypothetical protein OG426_09220 [Streptomyces canus]|uniref:hypothetical protein n=1 Tax=Streptomyces canus TaxID=58343 RepID=UPI00225A213B|nr:hypothetical protein [Streptomyces canus]MCX4862274.1 hypothetical protein [Streptomyces canus]WSW32635.1 hypothetical protein OG426_09220 [Streptomyces canus]